jgi:LysR family carnitine catabolism transcriptional activator
MGAPDVRIQLFDADLPTLISMVESGKLDMSLGIFKAIPGVRREPFFRFSLMVARAAKDNMPPRRTVPWSALDGETLISLSSGHPHQQLIDKHLAQAGVKVQIGSVVNLLDTQIALVEAEEGIAIIPSFGIPACRNRKVVVSQLVNPVARFDFHFISRRGRALPPGADEFTSFLKSYIAIWVRTRRCFVRTGQTRDTPQIISEIARGDEQTYPILPRFFGLGYWLGQALF